MPPLQAFITSVVTLLLAVTLAAPRGAAQALPFDAPELLFRGHGLITDGRPVGVPLGVLGTGRLDLCADGCFRSATLGPVAEPVPELPRSFITIGAARDGAPPVRAALTAGADHGQREVQQLAYRGLYPRAFLRGEDDALGLAVTVEAFAPLVPHDLEASTWPALGLLVTLEETRGAPATVSFELALEGDPALPVPVHAAPEPAPGVRVVRVVRGEADVGRASGAGNAAHAAAGAPEGWLPVQVDVDLPAHGRAELLLAIGWSTRDHLATARFADARASAEAFLPRARALREAVRAWQALLFDAGLPRWFAERLCNDLSPLTTNTRVSADGVLATAESGRGMNGITGTIDQRRVSAVATASWFPALDLTELGVFAARQAADGAIPHHVGSLSGPLAPDGGFLPWPDLACSFALQIAKSWLWTGDREAIAPLVPHVRRALSWLAARDTDGDGVPEGGSTYDYAQAPDGFVYTASMALAGFAAGARLGADFEDPALVDLAMRGADAAREALLTRHWNGRWFVTALDGASVRARESSHLSQLAGEWTARAFGLGALLPEALVTRAAGSLVTLHGRASAPVPAAVDAARAGAAPIGAVAPSDPTAPAGEAVAVASVAPIGAVAPWIPPLEVDADGRPGAAPWGWLPYTETDYASLLVLLGRADEGLAVLERLDAMLHGPAGDPFKVGLYYDPVSGTRARQGYEWYMSTPASWWALYALAGFTLDVPRGVLQLAPSLPLTLRDAALPVFGPGFTARLHVHDAGLGVERRMEFEVLALHDAAPTFTALRTRAPPTADAHPVQLVATLNGTPLAGHVERDGEWLDLRLDAPVTLHAGARLGLILTEPTSRAVGRTVEHARAAREIELSHERLRLSVHLGERGVERLLLRDPAGRQARLDVTDLFQLVVRPAVGRDLDLRTDHSWSRGVVVREVRRTVQASGPAPSLRLLHVIEAPRDDGTLTVEVEVELALVPDQAAVSARARVRTDVLAGAQAVTLRFPRVALVDPGTVGDPLVATLSSRPDAPVEHPVTQLDAAVPWAGPPALPWVEVSGPSGTFTLRGAAPLCWQRAYAVGDGRGAVALALHTALTEPETDAASRDEGWLTGAEARLELR